MPKKICNFSGCNNIIPFNKVYCDEHEKNKSERYIDYDKYRRDKKANKFYHSTEWLKVREVIFNRYKGIDMYLYLTEGIIAISTTVHHIEELKDNWNRRLDLDNLIPVSEATHKKIHAMYSKDKFGTQELLFSLIDKWKSLMVGGT